MRGRRRVLLCPPPRLGFGGPPRDELHVLPCVLDPPLVSGKLRRGWSGTVTSGARMGRPSGGAEYKPTCGQSSTCGRFLGTLHAGAVVDTEHSRHRRLHEGVVDPGSVCQGTPVDLGSRSETAGVTRHGLTSDVLALPLTSCICFVISCTAVGGRFRVPP